MTKHKKKKILFIAIGAILAAGLISGIAGGTVANQKNKQYKSEREQKINSLKQINPVNLKNELESLTNLPQALLLAKNNLITELTKLNDVHNNADKYSNDQIAMLLQKYNNANTEWVTNATTYLVMALAYIKNDINTLTPNGTLYNSLSSLAKTTQAFELSYQNEQVSQKLSNLNKVKTNLMNENLSMINKLKSVQETGVPNDKELISFVNETLNSGINSTGPVQYAIEQINASLAANSQTAAQTISDVEAQALAKGAEIIKTADELNNLKKNIFELLDYLKQQNMQNSVTTFKTLDISLRNYADKNAKLKIQINSDLLNYRRAEARKELENLINSPTYSTLSSNIANENFDAMLPANIVALKNDFVTNEKEAKSTLKTIDNYTPQQIASQKQALNDASQAINNAISNYVDLMAQNVEINAKQLSKDGDTVFGTIKKDYSPSGVFDQLYAKYKITESVTKLSQIKEILANTKLTSLEKFLQAQPLWLECNKSVAQFISDPQFGILDQEHTNLNAILKLAVEGVINNDSAALNQFFGGKKITADEFNLLLKQNKIIAAANNIANTQIKVNDFIKNLYDATKENTFISYAPLNELLKLTAQYWNELLQKTLREEVPVVRKLLAQKNNESNESYVSQQ
ncbi:hypothetical protein ACM0IS_01595 [Mycoplasma aquilae ATCC BAA-1896]|uniref:hypothetical protein n=1 Tax=Mycoplasma aquilae TaxID=1312741 RepID=UPI003A8B5F33